MMEIVGVSWFDFFFSLPPAGENLVLAGEAQQEEISDGANLTISFAGELLQNAEELIRMGLHPSEIISGYTKAINKTVVILNELVKIESDKMDARNKDEVVLRMTTAAVLAKQLGRWSEVSDHYRRASELYRECRRSQHSSDVLMKGASALEEPDPDEVI